LTNNRQKKFEQKLQKEIEARLIRQKTEAKKQHEAAGLKWYKTQKKQIITEVLAQSRLHKIKDM
jgi:restriction endonuclease